VPLPQTASIGSLHRTVTGYVPTSCHRAHVSIPVSQGNIFCAFCVQSKSQDTCSRRRKFASPFGLFSYLYSFATTFLSYVAIIAPQNSKHFFKF